MYQYNRNSFGQALVEMAITAPILILIMSGLLDLGRVYFTFIALEEAAAEAALVLSINPNCPTSTDPDPSDNNNGCANPQNALYRALTAGNGEFDESLIRFNIPYDNIAIENGFIDPFENCGSIGIGCIVVVQIKYPFELLTPVISNMAYGLFGTDSHIMLEVQATQIILCEPRDEGFCN